MRGPIDYIIVHFEGNNFKGKALDALLDAMEKGVIDVLDLAVVLKDDKGELSSVEISQIESEVAKKVQGGLITQDDIDEVGEILENNSAVGLLIIEQLWAKPLKKALLDANGTLMAEGRIHPEAAKELEK